MREKSQDTLGCSVMQADQGFWYPKTHYYNSKFRGILAHHRQGWHLLYAAIPERATQPSTIRTSKKQTKPTPTRSFRSHSTIMCLFRAFQVPSAFLHICCYNVQASLLRLLNITRVNYMFLLVQLNPCSEWQYTKMVENSQGRVGRA